MPDEKKTAELDRVEILRGLYADMAQRFDEIRGSIQMMRHESGERHAETHAAISELGERVDAVSTEFDALRSDFGELRHSGKTVASEVLEHGRKIASLERDFEKLHGEVERLRLTIDTDRSAVAKALEDASTKTEQSLREVSATVARSIDESSERHKTEVSAVAKHVARLESSIAKAIEGTASKEEVAKTNEALGAVVNALGIEGFVQLGRKVEPGETAPVPTLEKIESAAKSSRVVQGVIALAVIAQAIMRLLEHH